MKFFTKMLAVASLSIYALNSDAICMENVNSENSGVPLNGISIPAGLVLDIPTNTTQIENGNTGTQSGTTNTTNQTYRPLNTIYIPAGTDLNLLDIMINRIAFEKLFESTSTTSDKKEDDCSNTNNTDDVNKK